MTWGKLIYKSGQKLEIDDVELTGQAVRVMTAHDHKEHIIPFWNLAEIIEGEANGKEAKLKPRGY